jgi:glutathione S-transferase
MIKLYWHPRTRAARALWMLEELGEPYELVTVDIRDPAAKASAEGFLEASPMGKVPAITDGAVRMADSAAICLYLADRYASGRLAPALDAPSRGRFLWWMFYGPGVIEPAMAEKFSNAAPNRLSHGWGDFDSMIATLEQGLVDGPWLLGEQFTAADVMVGASAYFLKLFGILPASPAIEAYIARCLERPAYQSALSREGDAD